MRSPRLPWIFAALVALPAAGASRILVENRSDPSARVTIAFASHDSTDPKVEGPSAGSEIVVEAPAPRRRLQGGSLQTDPMIDLMARRQLREESPGPLLQVVNTGDAPAVFAPADGPLVYDDYGAGVWGSGVWGAGWYAPPPDRRCCSREAGRRSGGDGRQGGDRARPNPPRAPASGGSFQARGVIHRASR